MENQDLPFAAQTGATPEPQEAVEPPRESVGALLKAARERLGIDLGVISETLHIRPSYLEAIEASAYDKLPGGTYVIGFVRSYAEQLGLDGKELVRRYKLETNTDTAKVAPQSLDFPTPIAGGGVPFGAILLGALVIGAVGTGAWYLLGRGGEPLVPHIPAVLNEKVSPDLPKLPRQSAEDMVEAQKPAAPAVAEPAPIEAAPAPVEPQAAAPAPQAAPEPAKPAAAAPTPVAVPAPVAKVEPPKPATAPAAAPAPVAKTEPAKPAASPAPVAAAPAPAAAPAAKVELPKPAAAPAPVAAAAPAPAAKTEAAKPAEETEGVPQTPEVVQRTPRIYGAENANSRVEIVATADSWVQVTENGSLVLTRLLHAGDRFKVPNRGGLTMMTGNAGALDVVIDGKKVSAVGAPGQVMRDVSLDADRLQRGAGSTN